MDDAEGNKPRVFIIEDDSFLVKAYKTKFGKLKIGYDVSQDGNKALEYINTHKPADLVLLDLMLPGISGFDILKHIRESSAWSKTPVLIMSNLGQPEDIQQGLDLGAMDYMVKANSNIDIVIEKCLSLLNKK